jgi:hypothetical protein
VSVVPGRGGGGEGSGHLPKKATQPPSGLSTPPGCCALPPKRCRIEPGAPDVKEKVRLVEVLTKVSGWRWTGKPSYTYSEVYTS